MQNGIAVPEDPDVMREYLLTAFNPGDRVQMVVKSPETRRSLRQNAFFHGPLLKVFSEWNGDTPQAWKAFFKKHMLPPIINKAGEELVRDTADLTTKEYGEFLDRIMEFGRDEKLKMPHPDNCDY